MDSLWDDNAFRRFWNWLEVPNVPEITDDVGNPIAIPTFYVNITGGETAQQSWTFALLNNYISGLPAGNPQGYNNN